MVFNTYRTWLSAAMGDVNSWCVVLTFEERAPCRRTRDGNIFENVTCQAARLAIDQKVGIRIKFGITSKSLVFIFRLKLSSRPDPITANSRVVPSLRW